MPAVPNYPHLFLVQLILHPNSSKGEAHQQKSRLRNIHVASTDLPLSTPISGILSWRFGIQLRIMLDPTALCSYKKSWSLVTPLTNFFRRLDQNSQAARLKLVTKDAWHGLILYVHILTSIIYVIITGSRSFALRGTSVAGIRDCNISTF